MARDQDSIQLEDQALSEQKALDDTESGTKTGTDNESEIKAEAEIETATDNEAETEAEAETETATHNETDSEPDAEPEAETETNQQAARGTEGITVSDAGQDLLQHMLKWLGHESVPSGLVSILHSLIFASDKPLTMANLKKLLDNPDTKVLRSALRALQDIHRQMGVQLVEVAGGYQFRTNPEHAHWVKKLVPEKPVRLSRAALEVLAVIAYRQPVTRAEVEDVRGVDCGGVLRSLLERALIKIVGRKPEPGRPLLYGTTKEFLSFFGLKSLKDLPSLRDLDALEEERGSSQDAKTETVDSVLADDLAELIAEQDAPTIDEDPILEKALEEAREAAKQANRSFKALKQKEKALQPDEPPAPDESQKAAQQEPGQGDSPAAPEGTPEREAAEPTPPTDES